MNTRTFKTTVIVEVTDECLAGAKAVTLAASPPPQALLDSGVDIDEALNDLIINGMLSATMLHLHDESGESLPLLIDGASFDAAAHAPNGVVRVQVDTEEVT